MSSLKVEFTCKDTGRKLTLGKIPFTLTDLLYKEYDRQFPPPDPPTEEVDYGEGQKIREPNILHPTYLRLTREHDLKRLEWVNERARHLFTEIAIDCEIDTDEVKRYRESMSKFGITLDENDKYVYVWYICIGTEEGHRELIQAIQKRSQPTEGSIKEALDRFPS